MVRLKPRRTWARTLLKLKVRVIPTMARLRPRRRRRVESLLRLEDDSEDGGTQRSQ